MANNPLQEYYSARQAAAEARQANENYRIQQERALQEQAQQRQQENGQMKVLYADKYGNTSTSRGQMYGETEQMRRDNLERDMNAQSAGLFGNKIDPTISHDVAQNFSEYEQQAFGDLLSQGANIEDAYTAVKNGGSVTHDAGMLETAGGALKQIGVSLSKTLTLLVRVSAELQIAYSAKTHSNLLTVNCRTGSTRTLTTLATLRLQTDSATLAVSCLTTRTLASMRLGTQAVLLAV